PSRSAFRRNSNSHRPHRSDRRTAGGTACSRAGDAQVARSRRVSQARQRTILMSNGLAISGVTAVLQYFLNTVYNDPQSPFGAVAVSAIAPDIVQTNLAANARLQVNVFLHQVTPNAAWRNVDLPSLAPNGNTRLSNPPLALDLHYLLTAYA